MAVAEAPGAVPGAGPAEARIVEMDDEVKALRIREQQAWNNLDEAEPDDGPAQNACRRLSDELREAGEALAEILATTPAALAAKASAMCCIGGRGRWARTEAFTEHHELVAWIMRDAAALGGRPAGGLTR